jgi:hypothetical protein
MSVALPEPIAAYFAADKLGSGAVAHCFTRDGIVKDEGRTHPGRASIEQWKAETSVKYTYTCEPFRTERTGDADVVTCHLAGNFPGSPVDLRFFFRLERGKIATLEIIS